MVRFTCGMKSILSAAMFNVGTRVQFLRDSFKKAREAHIIHKAKTLEPLGINKRDEL